MVVEKFGACAFMGGYSPILNSGWTRYAPVQRAAEKEKTSSLAKKIVEEQEKIVAKHMTVSNLNSQGLVSNAGPVNPVVKAQLKLKEALAEKIAAKNSVQLALAKAESETPVTIDEQVQSQIAVENAAAKKKNTLLVVAAAAAGMIAFFMG